MTASAQLPRVLAVDDDEACLLLLERTLSTDGFQVTCATSGEEAVSAAQFQAPDVILLDILMKGIDGFQTCRRLKADTQTADIPVIFLTGEQRSEENLACAVGAGGCDYITKPFSRVEVLFRARNVIRRQQQRALLQKLGTCDPVTGLPERGYLRARIDEELVGAAHYDSELSVIMAGIDQLPQIAGEQGPEAADRAIQRLSLLLQLEACHHDVAGRWDPERLVLLLPRVRSEAATAAASRMCRIWRRAQIPYADSTLRSTATFSVSTHSPEDASTTVGALLRDAELALRLASGAGGDRVVCAGERPSYGESSLPAWEGIDLAESCNPSETRAAAGP